jgi:hypothetical protein
MNNFDLVFNNQIDTWDYQWVFTILINSGLGITPNNNLISNIGFNEDATHTKDMNSSSSNRQRTRIENICHPTFILQDSVADKYTYEHHCGLNLQDGVMQTIKRYIRNYKVVFSRKYI